VRPRPRPRGDRYVGERSDCGGGSIMVGGPGVSVGRKGKELRLLRLTSVLISSA
jgi:hypothetical protein